MPRSSVSVSRGVGSTIVGLAVLFGCAEERLTDVPVESESPLTNEAVVCEDECTIIEDNRPFRAALTLPDTAHPDSVAMDVFLADFTIWGVAGGNVTAFLDAKDEVLASVGAAFIDVAIDEVDRRYSLGELRHGVIVHTFDRTGSINVRYSMPRRVATIPEGSVYLSQIAEGVEVRAARTPWVRSNSPQSGIFSMSDPTCTQSVPVVQVSTVCNVTVTIAHFRAMVSSGKTRFRAVRGRGHRTRSS